MALASRIIRPILVIAVTCALLATASTSGMAQEDTPVRNILTNPDQYVEQEVSVTGAVDDILSMRSFALSTNETNDRLLVAGEPQTLPVWLEDNVAVNVTGTIHIFDPNASPDWNQSIRLNTESEKLAEFDGRPVLVVSQISTAEGADTTYESVTLANVLDNPDDFLGEQVSVVGTVEEVPAQDGFTMSVDSVDNVLLVRAPEDAIPGMMNEDAVVRANGFIRSYQPDNPSEWTGGLDIDPESDIFVSYEGDPILVANSVEVMVPALGKTVDEILESPDSFTDSEVNLVGEVSESLDPQAFTLEGTEGLLGFGETDLLVVGAQGAFSVRQSLQEGAITQIRGTVRMVNPDDPGEWADSLDTSLQEEILGEFDGEPVVVADSVNVLATEHDERVEEVLDRPGRYIGRSISIAGRVDEIYSDQILSLNGTDGLFGVAERDLLLVGGTGTIPADQLNDDAVVVAEGTVRVLDLDSSGEWDENFGIDPQGEIVREYGGDPVLVVTSVNPVVVE